MKTNKTILTTTLLIGATVTLLLAQDQRPPQQGSRPQGDRERSLQGRPGEGRGPSDGQRMQRPNFPLVDALDGNKNRIIEADEIANASTALKKLDKNNDGKLTADEFAPRFGGQGGHGPQGGGPGGPPSGQSTEGRRDRPKSE